MTINILPRTLWTDSLPLEVPQSKLPYRNVMFSLNRKAYNEHQMRRSPGPNPNTQECIQEIRYLDMGDRNKLYNRFIKYNFLLGPDGYVYEGRGWHNIPSLPLRFKGMRFNTMYITFIGDFKDVPPAPELFKLREEFLQLGVEEGFIHPRFTFYTLSPGDDLYQLSYDKNKIYFPS